VGVLSKPAPTPTPLVFVLQYLLTHPSPQAQAMVPRARQRLQEGYNRLISFESPGGGFGAIQRAKDTVTSSRGEAVEIEITALSVLNFLRIKEEFGAQARLGVEFLSQQCKSGRFVSTQATALVYGDCGN